MNNDTQSINPYSENKGKNNSNASKKAGIAAGVAGVAGIGTAAAYAATNITDNAPVVEAEEVIPVEETPIDVHSKEPVQENNDTHNDPRGEAKADQAEDQPENDNREDKPQEKSEDTHEKQDEGHKDDSQDQDQVSEPTEQELREYDDNNLDPDTEVDKILASEEIDINGDNDVTGDMIIHDYEDVGMIYGQDGEAQMAAVAYDPNGNQVLLVDVDGDHMFDNAYYEDGSDIDVSALAINVGDAEYEAAAQDEYLANNGENVENFDGNDFSQDIIS